MRLLMRETPIVYLALLSRVSQAFHEQIPITDHVKDGLVYKDAFDGQEAVDEGLPVSKRIGQDTGSLTRSDMTFSIVVMLLASLTVFD